MQTKPPIGPRIAIYGPTGSGKTTLARVIAQRTGLPVIDLDTIFWQPGWTSKPLEEFRSDVAAALAAHPHGWVCSGNYHTQLGGLVLSQADTVLWLRLPFRVTFWRLLKRTVVRAWTKVPVWDVNPNRESWRQSFLSKDSILLYAITSRKGHVERTQRNLRETPHHAQVIELRSAKAVRAFMGVL